MINLHWEQVWNEDELYKLQVRSVSDMMKCDSQHAVEATVEFAKYLHEKGLDSDNYPLFLELLREENHNVIEALIGGESAFDYFSRVEPNYYIVDFCFKMLYQYAPGGVYERTLELIFGILFRNYHRARAGWALYQLSIENLNSIGKFLDKSMGQNEGINRFILDILGDIAEYNTQNEEDERLNKIAAHAIDIRNAFFDRRQEMSSAMPPEILVRKDYRETSINPRKTKQYAEKKPIKT
jgi:hypothetical protein